MGFVCLFLLFCFNFWSWQSFLLCLVIYLSYNLLHCMSFSKLVKILFIKHNNKIEVSFNLSFVWYWKENYFFSLKVIAHFLIHGFIFIIDLEIAWLSLCFLFTEVQVRSVAMRDMIMTVPLVHMYHFSCLLPAIPESRLPLHLKIHIGFSKIGHIWSRFWCSSNENSV